MMKLTVLVDNTETCGWQSEHGLALMLELGSGLLLFDTGSGQALPENLKCADYSAGDIKYIVLSHGHYDHTGGLTEVLGSSNAELFCGCGIGNVRYSLHPGKPVKALTMPESAAAAMKNLPAEKLHFVKDFSSVVPGIYLSGTIERVSFEDCGGPFFLDVQGTVPDMISDENALLTDSGVLVTGCGHAGIINTIEHCRKHLPQVRIKKIAGGLHLLHASVDRLRKTAEYLNKLELEKIILLHCTGTEAVEFLKEQLDCEVISGRTGECYEL